ncbi:MAG: hypothetical protein COW00_05220 [Bdellovibrio sp. CG12_big_fil_rev_8_21_14_0_65_39_13]|nr:MAG: hypothetical protein COW00_05220 [Bdellovibrio sp. CG12_big_fil_rev_8_21_14_0_65_39_13]
MFKRLFNIVLVTSLWFGGFTFATEEIPVSESDKNVTHEEPEKKQTEYNEIKKVQTAKSDKENLGDVHDALGLDKIKFQEWHALLNAVAIGWIGSSLLTACKPTPADVMIAGASSVVYMAGEVYSSIKNRNIKERIEVDYKKEKEKNDAQFASLMAQRNAYENMEKTAKVKRDIQMAAAAGLTAAAGWAFLKSTEEKISSSQCVSGFSTAIAGLSSAETLCAGTTLGAGVCIAEVEKCKVSLGEGLAKLTEMNTFWETAPIDSIEKGIQLEAQMAGVKASSGLCLSNPVTAAAVAPVESACGYHFLKLEADKTACQKRGLILTVENQHIFKLIDEFIDLKIDSQPKFANLDIEKKTTVKNIIWRMFSGISEAIIPSANAWDLKSTLGLGAVGAGLVIGLVSTEATAMDQFFAAPTHRAIAFGIMAGSIGYAGISSNKIAKDMAMNKSEIDRIMKNYNDKGLAKIESGDSRSTQSGDITNLNRNAKTDSSFDETKLEESLPCLAGETSGKCNQIGTLSERDTKFLDHISASSLMSAPMQLANSLSGAKSLSQGTLNLASSGAGKMAVSVKFLRKTRERYLAELKKGPNGELDKFLKEESKQRDHLFSLPDKVLKEKGADRGMVLASLNASANALENGEQPKSDLQKEIQKQFNDATKGSVVLNAPPTSKPSDINFKFDLEGDEGQELAKLEHEDFNLSGMDKGHELLDSQAQIAPDDGYSIFHKISKRYLKTAYPLLFKEKVN